MDSTTKIETFDDLVKYIKDYLRYCMDVQLGKKLDSDGNKIPHDDFHKGMTTVSVMMSNAVDALQVTKGKELADIEKRLETKCKACPHFYCANWDLRTQNNNTE